MTSTQNNNFSHKLLRVLSIFLFTLSINASQAAVTDLGTAPLVSATTGDVLPNLMYIFDDSGSMAWDFMPDYVARAVPGTSARYDKCKTVGSSGNFTNQCLYGDPPYMANDFNSIYYNPETTYTPAVDASGLSLLSMTSANTANWTAVPNDPYNTAAGDARLVPNAGFLMAIPTLLGVIQQLLESMLMTRRYVKETINILTLVTIQHQHDLLLLSARHLVILTTIKLQQENIALTKI